MFESTIRQLLSAIVRRRAERIACKYFLMVRTSRGAVMPVAYCVTLDEAQEALRRVIEDRRRNGFTVVSQNELTVTVMKYEPQLDIFICLIFGIEQAPYLIRASRHAAGFSSN